MAAKKEHWDEVYQKKKLTEVSWYEPVPETSLSIIKRFKMPKEAAIIDIGGGDSLLVDCLLSSGYSDITVLDISATAIEKAKARLGERSKLVKWIVSDVLDFANSNNKKYDLWHDRAAFHFLTNQNDQQAYLNIAHRNVQKNGYLVLSTFSVDGPEKCSGLSVQQYSEKSLSSMLNAYFEKIKCITKKHVTPLHAVQSFLYCSFRNRSFKAA